MAEYRNLLIGKKGSITTVTVNREKVLNALNKETVAEMQSFFSGHWTDNSIGCVIITGAGDKAFVAGADIAELAELDASTGVDLAARGQYLMRTIQNFPRPVIAAVNGFALGGGCELAMACDIRLASEKAKFGQPEVNLGVIPGYGGTQRLSRLVGVGKAMQLILTGEIINAQEAHRIGLVDEIYPHELLQAKAIEMAELIASKGPLAVASAKECLNRGLEMTLPVGCVLEKANFGQICGTQDKNEGTKAFLEKRKAEFKGK
ncbi:MAG: enoyl-CoA hydratase-related protein [Candidatus Zixiibacteriota bacterium]